MVMSEKRLCSRNAYFVAGILKNVPTDVALRPQRTVDLLIVMDFNGYESDTFFDYKVTSCFATTHGS